MSHNPMVVKKLFPESHMAATADRNIMTPPVTLGGGYRYNQLPPIDPSHEMDPSQFLNHASHHSKVSKSSANSSKQNNAAGSHSRVFSARADEVGVKRAVKAAHQLQKENYFDYSRPSTTAEIRVSFLSFLVDRSDEVAARFRAISNNLYCVELLLYHDTFFYLLATMWKIAGNDWLLSLFVHCLVRLILSQPVLNWFTLLLKE